MNQFYVKKKAFTLAEVLITLGIIGVVAALTIPTLIQDSQSRATVTGLKKAYATLQNAFDRAVDENGTPDTWDLVGNQSATGATNMLNALAPFLNITKNCGTGTGCLPTASYKYMSGADEPFSDSTNNVVKVQMADGSLFLFETLNKDCAQVRGNSLALQNSCGDIMVDVNGLKQPNQEGKDAFWFVISKYGIVPFGSQQDTTTRPFSTNCVTGSTGWGCAAWVIYNENQDYLKCSGSLSWTGATKCP